MSKTIGVVGLGIMGGAFARNLAAAGWRVIGCDLEPARCEEARAVGVEIADGTVAVAEAAADIITSLPTPKAVLETAQTIARGRARSRRSPRPAARRARRGGGAWGAGGGGGWGGGGARRARPARGGAGGGPRGRRGAALPPPRGPERGGQMCRRRSTRDDVTQLPS